MALNGATTAIDIERMRRCGRNAARILSCMASTIRPGISTADLRQTFDMLTAKHGVSSAMLRHRGFPSTLSISVNPTICRAVPTPLTVLRDGDVVNIDLAVSFEGWITDTCATFSVGVTPSPEDVRLLQSALEALRRGIQAIRAHGELRAVAAAIEGYVRTENYYVVPGLDGHGVGRTLHETPVVSHVTDLASDAAILPGMAFTIEPVVLTCPSSISFGGDGWSLRAEDGCRSACFEHTLLVKDDGVEILTVANDQSAWAPPGANGPSASWEEW